MRSTPQTDLGRHLGGRRQLRGQVQPLRLAGLHRRCVAAPDGDPAGSGHHEPLSADPGAVRRRDRPARGPVHPQRHSSGTAQPSPIRSRPLRPATSPSAPPGSTRSTAWSPRKRQLRSVKPAEGATGWSDTWMIASDAAHPNCMYMWMDHMMSAEANGQATMYFGEAPTSQEACDYAETMRYRDTASRPTRPTKRTGTTSGTGARPAKTAPTRTRPRPASTTTPGWRRGPPCGASSPLIWTDPMLPGAPPPGSIILTA